MDWRSATDSILIATPVALCLYNVAARILGGGEATISARVQHYAVRYPVIPFAFGFACAHWFWPVFGLKD